MFRSLPRSPGLQLPCAARYHRRRYGVLGMDIGIPIDIFRMSAVENVTFSSLFLFIVVYIFCGACPRYSFFTDCGVSLRRRLYIRWIENH